MSKWEIQLTNLKDFKRKIEKLRYDTSLKTITRKYYKGSQVWVLVYER